MPAFLTSVRTRPTHAMHDTSATTHPHWNSHLEIPDPNMSLSCTFVPMSCSCETMSRLLELLELLLLVGTVV